MENIINHFLPFVLAHWPLFVSLVIILGVIFVFERQVKAAGAASVDPQMAIDWINRQEAIIIDIRDKEAFRKGHIIHSESMEPANVLATVTQGKQAEKYKDKPLLIVCAQGVSAVKTANVLKKEGIEKVGVLKGGIQAWVAADLPLEKK